MKTREQMGNKTTAAEKFLKVIARKNKWIEGKKYTRFYKRHVQLIRIRVISHILLRLTDLRNYSANGIAAGKDFIIRGF